MSHFVNSALPKKNRPRRRWAPDTPFMARSFFEEAELLHLLDQRAAAHFLQRHDIRH